MLNVDVPEERGEVKNVEKHSVAGAGRSICLDSVGAKWAAKSRTLKFLEVLLLK